MKKKDYQKPTMQVVKLQHKCQILAGSLTSVRDDYGDAIEQTWSSREMIELDDENDF